MKLFKVKIKAGTVWDPAADAGGEFEMVSEIIPRYFLTGNISLLRNCFHIAFHW